MNKIKKFKIKPHLKDITRRVYRTNLDLKSAGIMSEVDLHKQILNYTKKLAPGVIYRFFDTDTDELMNAGFIHDGMFSACVATLGAEVEADLEAAEGEPVLQTVLGICFFDFLRSAVTFVSDLIKDAAEAEEFEAGGLEVIYAPAFTYGAEPKFLKEALKIDGETAVKALPVLFNILQTDKIDVKFEDGNVIPKGTVVFLMPWNKSRKRRKK
ncbi:hypothetical protein Dip518_001396 [Parelusimicrobium proximum]|uniref:hypothetical protein n=1 Tax=Parelusimicrobium proximum TaxID=3228953 RepID=UPI003D1759F9